MSDRPDTLSLEGWKKTGFYATVVIALSFPLYLAVNSSASDDNNAADEATFVGARACLDCHKKEYDLWTGSDHDRAMEIATDSSVLGDFDNTEYTSGGVTSRFYKKNGKFFVYTRGVQGAMREHEITHAFGVEPLQQYLVPFEGGRMQCLPIAWDTEKKCWFDLSAMVYPDQNVPPGDWLYWTNAGQNWNGMCAECHSTNLKKNYDPETETYNTTWSEIDVSCEACHGASSKHIDWAKLPDMARPLDNNLGLPVQTSNISSVRYVELCAPCHARRSQLGDNDHTDRAMLDLLLPQLLLEEYYFADGQILAEDYVYASFVQSKMYENDVRCSDCHDVHSTKLVKDGNDLCLQCHRSDIYDVYSHHFHKKKGEAGQAIVLEGGTKRIEVGEGADCVKCHMPASYYMGIDERSDHSIRVPRPDLSLQLGTPNACNQCHKDKSVQWSADATRKWYGISRRPHYGTVLAAGREGKAEARKDLMRLAKDELFPVVVRATALTLLAYYDDEESRLAIRYALEDPEALMRQTALRNFNAVSAEELLEFVAPLIHDETRVVRMQAAMNLSSLPADRLDSMQTIAYRLALVEYEKSMQYVGDFSAGRLNLGNLYANLGRLPEAEKQFKTAIKIDNQFYPAKVNLAMLYNRMGQNDKAEALLREIIARNPDYHEVSYSLGLLLAEEKRYADAVIYLEKAAKGMPARARIHYNLGLLLQFLQRDEQAETELKKAVRLEVGNIDFLYALAEFYMKRQRMAEARAVAQQIVATNPGSPLGPEMLRAIEQSAAN